MLAGYGQVAIGFRNGGGPRRLRNCPIALLIREFAFGTIFRRRVDGNGLRRTRGDGCTAGDRQSS